MRLSSFPSIAATLALIAALCGRAPAQAADVSAAPETAVISLDEALRRAGLNEPSFAAAAAEQRALRLERTDARAALLPTATYHNQAIYTQPNGNGNRIGLTIGERAPIFIANNAIREYVSQGVFNETVGFAQLAAIRVADANAAISAADLEVARRGLVAAVVSLFYGLGSQIDKVGVATSTLAEADHFVEVTRKREAARETAHADVIKAQLQQQTRQRELAEAKLSRDKARVELGVLLFPDPGTAFTLAAAAVPPPLPERGGVETAARRNNPELRSALAAVQLSQANSYAARAALLPDLALNFTYGIDAPQIAVNGQTGTRNLGYSFGATLDIPVWDWLTTERRIKESRIRQGATAVLLSATQRRLLANLAEFYAEAATAQAQLASLDATVLSARDSLRLINLRYTDGESTVLEVVDAQTTLSAAENAQLDGRVRYQLALAQLQTLTGSL